MPILRKQSNSANGFQLNQSYRRLERCPACFLIRDCTLKDFKCTLTRCPHVFAEIEPPSNRPTVHDNDQGRSNLKRLTRPSLPGVFLVTNLVVAWWFFG